MRTLYRRARKIYLWYLNILYRSIRAKVFRRVITFREVAHTEIHTYKGFVLVDVRSQADMASYAIPHL